MTLRVVGQHLDRVEAHRLGVDQPSHELCRVEELQERALVRGARERGRVALVEAEAGEGRDPAKELLRLLAGQAVAGDATINELFVELLHLAAGAPRAHGSSEAVRLGGREPGHVDRDLHHLLLVEDHAERLLERRLEARMEVRHLFLALSAAQVRVDRVALDGPRPDDRDLDHEIVEVLRP